MGRKKSNVETVSVSARVPVEWEKALKHICKEENRSISSLIGMLILNLLKERQCIN